MIMLPSGLRSSLIERRPDIHAAEQTLVATNPETIPDPLACHLEKGISHERTQQESARN